MPRVWPIGTLLLVRHDLGLRKRRNPVLNTLASVSLQSRRTALKQQERGLQTPVDGRNAVNSHSSLFRDSRTTGVTASQQSFLAAFSGD